MTVWHKVPQKETDSLYRKALYVMKAMKTARNVPPRESIFASRPAPAQALAPHPVQEDRDARGEEHREHHVREDADVGAVPLEAEFEGESEDDEENASPRDHRPDKTDRVSVQAAATRRFFVRHDRPPPR
jgi:hypothetical protein